MKFIDGVSVNQAKAYVSKQEAFWHEDYMSSGCYLDMSFDEYIETMGITKYRDSLKKALNDLMEKESEEISLMKNYRATNKKNEFFDFKVEDDSEIRTWIINHLDLSHEWFVFKKINYEEAGRIYINNEAEVFELHEDGTESLFGFNHAVDDGVILAVEVAL